MANNKTNEIADITEFDRTVNYIQFQLSQAETMLAKFHGTDKPKICFAHLIAWKQSLQTELHELRKAARRK
jgi:hypothetical protein